MRKVLRCKDNGIKKGILSEFEYSKTKKAQETILSF